MRWFTRGSYHSCTGCNRPSANGSGKSNDTPEDVRVLLANGCPSADAIGGPGGQGVDPLPVVRGGWVHLAVNWADTGQLSQAFAF
jgi:hypothetical protein